MFESPVPIKQRPVEEFIELRDSYFFSWPVKNYYNLYRNILFVWIISLPIFIIITSESYSTSSNLFLFISISFFSSTIVPILIILRQHLGWSYIYRRLLSEIVTYEESDWHDGKIWRKPETFKSRDNLIAKEEVLPILSKIKMSFLSLIIIITLASILLLLIRIS